MFAALMGQLEFVRLFLQAGADARLAMPESGETALHMAAVAGKTAAVRMPISVVFFSFASEIGLFGGQGLFYHWLANEVEDDKRRYAHHS